MLFTKIRLAGRTNIDLPFFGLRPTNTYILKAVDGLGPPEVGVFLSNGLYQGRRPQDKQLIVRVGLNPNHAVGQTVSSIRNTLYGLLTPGPSDAIVVKLMNGPNVVATVTGYVSKLEIVPFSKDPEVQITIECDSPYLKDENPTVIVPETKSSFTINNGGSVTTGFYFDLTFNADAASFVLRSEAPATGPKMQITYAFLAGDTLMVDTRKNQKTVQVKRGSTTTRIIKALSSDSVWFQLHPGENDFWATPDTFDWVQTIHHRLHWGI